MTRRTLSRSALLILALHAASGCSFGMKQAPSPIAAPDRPVDCNASSTAPVLDTICAAILLSTTINIAGLRTCTSNYDSDCADSSDKSRAMLLTGGAAALCAVGAATGYTRAARCDEVRAANTRCIKGDEAACMKLNSEWRPSLRAPGAPPPPALPPEGQATPPAPTPPEAGCTRDVDCKGDRVCEQGICMAPRVKAGP